MDQEHSPSLVVQLDSDGLLDLLSSLGELPIEQVHLDVVNQGLDVPELMGLLGKFLLHTLRVVIPLDRVCLLATLIVLLHRYQLQILT